MLDPRTLLTTLLVTVSIQLVLAGALFADSTPANTAKDTGQASPALIYKPPLRGAPRTRVGGGTRGAGDNLPVLSVLAPDHTGLTTTAQPTLYWYLSRPTAVHLEVSLITDDKIEPILEINQSAPQTAGIHSLSLADKGISLEPGVMYQWSVALVPDPQQRSRDIMASGTIQRVPPDASLARKLSAAPTVDRSQIYLEAGMWYDGLDALNAQIDAHPQNMALLAQRVSLLNQIGLTRLTGQLMPDS